jgi:molybdopterin-dependent oxidoreductase alpha subunit
MKNSAGGLHSIGYTIKAANKVGWFKLFRAMKAKNSCKTCALGMGGQKGGMRNEMGRWPEVCKKSIQAMVADMQSPVKDEFFNKYSIKDLENLTPRELEHLGRINQPLFADENSTHFKPITWEESFQKVTTSLIESSPENSFFYFSGRSSNEAGFLLQLMARAYGTNNINNCSYYCHQASGVGLNNTLGSGTATLSLEDLENTDLLMIFGGNPTSNHPRLMTSIMHIKRRGGKVIIINPLIEPGLKKFRIPSDFRSFLFGTKVADLYLQPKIGGDIALILGIAKHLLESDSSSISKEFIKNHTKNWEEFKKIITSTSWEEVTENSGLSKNEIKKAATLYLNSKNAVFSWTMGITHHIHGVENVESIVNLALMRAMVGKPGSGLLPIRGHSNVQGMGTMAVTPGLKKSVFDALTKIGVKIPDTKGMDTMECMEASARGEVKSAWCLGGNLYGSNPDSAFAKTALKKIDFLTYLNTTLNTGHLHGRGKKTLILPVAARDEEDQLTTQESMFNFLRVSDGGSKRVSEAKTEVEIISQVAQKLFEGSDSANSIKWDEMKDHKNIRTLISKCIPGMEKITDVDQNKNEFTIPGRIYNTPNFNTDDGLAKFSAHPIPKAITLKENELNLMSIRSEGQFNTVVYEEEDAFRGIKSRDIIMMNPEDIKRMGFKDGQRVNIKNELGCMNNIEIKAYNIKAGNAGMYFPEVNQLISRKLDPRSKTPAFKTTVVSVNLNS